MAIAKDTWLELILCFDEIVVTEVVLQTGTNLNTTIGVVFAIMGDCPITLSN